MKDLKKMIWDSLAKQKIASIWKWAYINQVLKSYIKNNLNLELEIIGYIKNDIFCVKVWNSSLSNLLFLHKKKVLDHINLKLKDLNFDKILDIKLL